MKDKDKDRLVRRIDAALALFLLIIEGKETKLELPTLFCRFKKLGFTNKDIAKITGRTPAQVAKIAYEFKRKRKKRK